MEPFRFQEDIFIKFLRIHRGTVKLSERKLVRGETKAIFEESETFFWPRFTSKGIGEYPALTLKSKKAIIDMTDFRSATRPSGSRWFLICLVAAAFAVAITTQEEEEENPERFSKASCSFTLDLLKHVATKYNSSNIIFSPASISILLAVLQQGAKENTLSQLKHVLHLSAEESKRGFSKLSTLKEEKEVTLEWGNRCYVRPGLELDVSYKETIQNSFDVGVEELNFGAPQESAYKINKWVGETTHDHIKDLVDSSLLGPETIMLLINAIFFKGNWLSPFKKGKTAENKFEISTEDSVQTLFMFQREKFYADKDSSLGAKWVQLPFQNKRFAMIFILPSRRHRLSQLIGKLTSEDLYQIFSHRGVSQVKLRIPKFKLSEKVSLVDTLQELGLTDIFFGDSNLSGMTSKSESLHVSEIIHQANIEIDEKGSTGSAATVVQLLRMRTPNLSFVADQPFLFFIIDVESKIPLFAGKVVNPKS